MIKRVSATRPFFFFLGGGGGGGHRGGAMGKGEKKRNAWDNFTKFKSSVPPWVLICQHVMVHQATGNSTSV